MAEYVIVPILHRVVILLCAAACIFNTLYRKANASQLLDLEVVQLWRRDLIGWLAPAPRPSAILQIFKQRDRARAPRIRPMRGLRDGGRDDSGH
jgi:hypothetical protein